MQCKKCQIMFHLQKWLLTFAFIACWSETKIQPLSVSIEGQPFIMIFIQMNGCYKYFNYRPDVDATPSDTL